MSLPRNAIVPWAGLVTPQIACIVELFPAPFAPMRATISPSSTQSETPWTARAFP